MLTRREIRRAIRALLTPRRVSAELDDEIAHHLEMEAARHTRDGLTAAAAERLAERRFGNVAAIKTELANVHRCGAPAWMAAPGVAAARVAAYTTRNGWSNVLAGASITLAVLAALVALALTDGGLGVRRALASSGSKSVVEIGLERFAGDRSAPQMVLPYTLVSTLRGRVSAFAEVAALRVRSVPVRTRTEVRVAAGAFVSSSYPQTVRARLRMGRWPGWGGLDGGADSVVVSDAFWRSALQAAPNVIGTALAIAGKTHVIAGVVDAESAMAGVASAPDVWLPIDRSSLRIYPSWRTNPQVHSVHVVARLHDGVTYAGATAELNRLASTGAVPAPRLRVLSIDEARGRAPPAWSPPRVRTVLGTAICVLLISAVVPVVSRRGRHSSTGATESVRGRLVPHVQLTAASALAVSAGLLGHSVWRVAHEPLGMHPAAVLALSMDAVPEQTFAQADSAYQRLLGTASELEPVVGAALSAVLPMRSSYAVEVRTDAADDPPLTIEGGPYLNAVTSRYFDVMGTRVLRGRAFTDADREGAPRVVVVNATTARLWWRDSDPLGRCVYLDGGRDCARVVGVVEDARRRAVLEEPSAQLFVPLAQAPPPLAPGALILRVAEADVAQSGRARDSLVEALQARVPDRALATISLDAVAREHWRSLRRAAWAFGLIATVALLVAVPGVYRYAPHGQPMSGTVLWMAILAAVGGAALVWLARAWVEPLLYRTPFVETMTAASAALATVILAGSAALSVAAGRAETSVSAIRAPAGVRHR